MMSLRSGMRVLDVGCGVGGPAKEMITFAGCEVVGLNNNAYQVKKGRELAKQDGLETKVELVKGDFMVGVLRHSCHWSLIADFDG